ncbi:MAG: dephospho-CoA kinase [Bacillota bacterium]
MKVIGLTGGIASGKSTVSSMLKKFGAIIIDVDEIARKVVSKGEIAYNKIIESYGREILLSNGEINRKKLGSIVFSDKGKLELLNKITHPEIIESVKKEIELLRDQGCKVAVVDAAILIEMGLNKYVDYVWLVVVDKETQIQRLIERDRLTSLEALNRINSQFTNQQRMDYADVIIDNNKPIEEVEDIVTNLWNNISRGDS